ncbi:hypothetical protein CBR_g26223 [Chara braunii]|uniref:Uncharacterized protein n=1 Tax=Chara braunii TaxID=69332 RepID=A0A388L7A0_CHABU|nr:hypothetical protein CBR_g26223 [Chara braunii]|eukprot:GBG78190.1 hypothetical protein CBR_g26223 [Chara braunii]
MDRGPRSPPAPNESEEDNVRLRELARRCYEDGVMPTGIDPGEMSGEGREVRFKVNRNIDQVKIAWLKEHTVTIIFRDGARFLSRKVKEDIMRAFEDEKVAGGALDAQTFSRGRVKIESPNVLSYVAKSSAIATFFILKGRDELTIGTNRYVLEFKPWLTKAQLRAQRLEEDDSVFWVTAVQVPLDAFFYLQAQIARAIGPILRTHPVEQDCQKPALINVKFDIDPSTKDNMKDKIWMETCEGDELEVRLASAGTPRCRTCKAFFHSDAECRRNQQQGHGSQYQQGQASSASRPQYQGVMRPMGGQGAPGGAVPNEVGGTSQAGGEGVSATSVPGQEGVNAPLGSERVTLGQGLFAQGVRQQPISLGNPSSFLPGNLNPGQLNNNPLFSLGLQAMPSGNFYHPLGLASHSSWMAHTVMQQYVSTTSAFAPFEEFRMGGVPLPRETTTPQPARGLTKQGTSRVP